jgi:hypothetical protein
LQSSFPEDQGDNPDRLIVPIPVDPENDQFPEAPNDTFPIVSSTGIDGQGCRAAGGGADGGDPDDTDSVDGVGSGDVDAGEVNLKDEVITGTIPDKLLPNTGGMPLLALVVTGLALVDAGISVLRSTIRRTT